MVQELLYRFLRKYEIQLQQIEGCRDRLKMKARIIDKVGQVLFLHFDKWKRKKQGSTIIEKNKSSEIAFVEKFIGRMGEKTARQTLKVFEEIVGTEG